METGEEGTVAPAEVPSPAVASSSTCDSARANASMCSSLLYPSQVQYTNEHQSQGQSVGWPMQRRIEFAELRLTSSSY